MELTSLGIAATADILASGRATAVEVATAYLQRIKRLNSRLNAYLAVFEIEAIAQARQSDRRRGQGKSRGQLDGVPIALKDNISTQDQPTTAGSRLLENYRPLYSATVVNRLAAAGAVILGKTNLDEFAMGSSTENSAYGPTKNPWDLTRVPGGSSGGSAAAVAANLCAAALGSDTGGSIRQPAGFCGVVGLKPTYGAVSRSGLLAMASSLDQIGPLTKTVNDARILLAAIAGPDRFDATTRPVSDLTSPTDSTDSTTSPRSPDLTGLRLGLPQEYFGSGLDPAVKKTIGVALTKLTKLGAEIKEVSLPNSALALAAYYIICPVEVASNMARYDGIRYGQSVERAGQPQRLLDVYLKTRAHYLGPEVKRRIMLGTYASSAGYAEAYYRQALKVRSLIINEYEKIFKTVDCLITPVSPTVAFKLGSKSHDPLAMYLADIYTVPANSAGLPVMSLPCGFIPEESKSLPVGLQLIGPAGAETMLFRVASSYEAAADWINKKPKQAVD